jgi:hypothetical protein
MGGSAAVPLTDNSIISAALKIRVLDFIEYLIINTDHIVAAQFIKTKMPGCNKALQPDILFRSY